MADKQDLLDPGLSVENAPPQQAGKRPLIVSAGIGLMVLGMVTVGLWQSAHKSQPTETAAEDQSQEQSRQTAIEAVKLSLGQQGEIRARGAELQPESRPSVPRPPVALGDDELPTAEQELTEIPQKAPETASPPPPREQDLQALRAELMKQQQAQQGRQGQQLSEAEKRRLAEEKKQAELLAKAMSAPIKIDSIKQGQTGGSSGGGYAGGGGGGSGYADAQRQALSERQQQMQAQKDALRQEQAESRAAAEKRLEDLRQQAADIRTSAAGGSDTRRPGLNADGTMKEYSQLDRKDDYLLDEAVTLPISKYHIRAGTFIPAVLINGLNSDLPGQVLAQVSQNVYDTATGRYLLIPQGTRLLGQYASGVKYGQERVFMAWHRLTFPDGRVMNIGTQPGTDKAGYSGVTDIVDNHWWKIINAAVLLSGITATVSVATADDSSSSDDDSNSLAEEMRISLASELGSVMTKIIERDLNVSPTLIIRPGYELNVLTTKDLMFVRPYTLTLP